MTRNHRLLVDQPDNSQWLDVDAVRISQVVSNFLTNAARYMNPGGDVRLSITQEGDEIVVSVADSGFGIAPDLLSDVFEMFVRGKDSAAAAPGGLGIGLTLAKTLVEMHGGSIAVKSEGPDQGREFGSTSPIVSADLEVVDRKCGGGIQCVSTREGNQFPSVLDRLRTLVPRAVDLVTVRRGFPRAPLPLLSIVAGFCICCETSRTSRVRQSAGSILRRWSEADQSRYRPGNAVRAGS